MRHDDDDLDEVMMQLKEVFHDQTSRLENSDDFEDAEGQIKLFSKPDMLESTDN